MELSKEETQAIENMRKSETVSGGNKFDNAPVTTSNSKFEKATHFVNLEIQDGSGEWVALGSLCNNSKARAKLQELCSVYADLDLSKLKLRVGSINTSEKKTTTGGFSQ